MTGKQNNRVKRGVGIAGVLRKNSGVWAGDIHIAAVLLGIDNSVARCVALRMIQNTRISGNTRNKLMRCISMATAGAIYSAMLLDWAVTTKNFLLADEIAFSFTKLNRGSADNVIYRNQLVHDRMNTYIEDLIKAGYFITEDDVASYQTLIDDFTASKPLWKAADLLINAATAELVVEMNNLTVTLFDRLKGLLLRFEGINSIFYGTCINRMKSFKSGMRRKYLMVEHIDSVTRKRITGVKDTLTLNAKDYVIDCSRKGFSTYYSLGNGNGRLLSVKKGYVSLSTMNLSLRDGKLLKIVVEMVREIR